MFQNLVHQCYNKKHCFKLIAVQQGVYLTELNLNDGSHIMVVGIEAQQQVTHLLPEVTEEQNIGELISLPQCKNSTLGFFKLLR